MRIRRPSPFRASFADRLAARIAARGPAVAGIDAPHFIGAGADRGDAANGARFLDGDIRLGGVHVRLDPEDSLWDLHEDAPEFIAATHGFAWLDDLVTLGTEAAHERARALVGAWIRRFGRGRGPGWAPVVASARLARMTACAGFLVTEGSKDETHALHAAFAHHLRFLDRRARALPRGAPRITALATFVEAALLARGAPRLRTDPLRLFVNACLDDVADDGTIPSRNPEELLDILTAIIRTLHALEQKGFTAPPELSTLADRIARDLRILRHANGALPRFHGGGTGAPGVLDRALAMSRARAEFAHCQRAMGYFRLSGGRVSLIIDAAESPGGAAAIRAHASTGAFELVSGRRPLIVNCGPGRLFGGEWASAARATQSHSALAIAGHSSSRFGPGRRGAAPDSLDERARITRLDVARGDGALVRLAHDGWSRTHGLIATRELNLSADGRRLGGLDMLATDTPEHRRRLDEILAQTGGDGVPFAIHFHLHPDVVAATAPRTERAHEVTLTLLSGEVWLFRHDGRATLSLAPSAYLDERAGAARPTLRITLAAHARDFATRISWTLAKSADTPVAIRDLAPDTPRPWPE